MDDSSTSKLRYESAPRRDLRSRAIGLAALSGLVCGIFVGFSGFAAPLLLLASWLIGPLIVGYMAPRHCTLAASAFNMSVLAVPLLRIGWSIRLYDLVTARRHIVIELLVAILVGWICAQLARLTAARRRSRTHAAPTGDVTVRPGGP